MPRSEKKKKKKTPQKDPAELEKCTASGIVFKFILTSGGDSEGDKGDNLARA